VSGQNVAFALAAAWPLLRLLRLRGRWTAGLAILVLFGVLTRWEPSVLRAEAMAAIAMTAHVSGRPASAIRVLALAVAGLLVVDPLLVGSVGFLLSAGACAGIILLAAPLARRIPGPRPLATALGVTLAAQIGVAPVLVPVFGGIPAAALPANLLAVPAAGPVTVWGMTAGVVAGLVGGDAARVLHVPTNALVGWIAGVAHWAAALPLAQLGVAHLAVIAIALVADVRFSPLRVPAAATVTVMLLAPVWATAQPLHGIDVGGGPHLWRGGGATVLVADRAGPAPRVLADLRALGVARLDAVVMERGSGAARALDPVLQRYRPRALLTRPGTVAKIGPFLVTVEEQGRATVRRP
jgi:competence protein ComEC